MTGSAGGPRARSAPRWYQEAIIYELHVRAFADSNGDGIGDFDGLRSRLDYLQDLGVTALWLLPFYPSPLRDDGYDIADYATVNPGYGDLRSFKRLLREAHSRDLRLITEIVINHTSDQHPWFARARAAPPGSVWRDFYVWSDDPHRFADARIIFEDFEQSNWTWDQVAGAYYWHRFYSHQPDLNFDNPAVQDAVFAVMDHWLEMGIDGVRLDAVPYLFEREGTNCENLPETHDFLRRLRRHVDEHYEDRMLLAEANQWPEDAAAYFGDGDECHMNFHFPLMPRLFIAVRQEDSTPIIDILEQTPATPAGCQWALFLRNHDELTLEMVTDEERDYMYRTFAKDPLMKINAGIRRRLAPLLGNDRRKIELLNVLLFTMPGTPVLYYGDEIGMGDNVYLGDRDGVRTPMQWSADRNAGFSVANPHSLFLPAIIDSQFHYERVNVENQRGDPESLLSWMRQIIAVRRANPVLAHGDITFLHPENHHVLAFRRTKEGVPPVLVVANLSRLPQAVELDLREHLGTVPHELFGGTAFSRIGELPYYLTLSPYGHFIFQLRSDDELPQAVGVPRLDTDWGHLFTGRNAPALGALRRWLPARRWFAGKDRTLTHVRLAAVEPLGDRRRTDLVLAMVSVAYLDGERDLYAVPMARLAGERARITLTLHPEAVIARLAGDECVADAMADDETATRVLRALLLNRRTTGPVTTDATPALRTALRAADPERNARVLGVEQSNTSAVLGDVIFKLIRRVDRGVNPDAEVGRHLAHQGFAHIAPVLGTVDWHRTRTEVDTVAIASRYVANQGDAWQSALDHLGRFYDTVLTEPMPPFETAAELDIAALERSGNGGSELIGGFAEGMTLLGTRTGELHAALAQPTAEAFEPEPFSKLYQRSLYQGFRGSLRSTLTMLGRRKNQLREELRPTAAAVAEGSDRLEAIIAPLRGGNLDAMRIRTHGDFHLGQVLVTQSDFVIIDFEGEPARPTSERRIKRSPLVDVAGMVRSFDYAARVALQDRVERGLLSSAGDPIAGRWAGWWRAEMTSAFLRGYLAVPEARPLLPPDGDDLRLLLQAYVLDKALYELRYELAHRPAWAAIPLDALCRRVRGDGVRG